MKTKISAIRSQIKNYQDFIFPGIIMIGSIVTFSVTLITACNKNEILPRQSFIVPVSYRSDGCPYPPGCDAYIESLVLNNYLLEDKSISVKTIGDRVAISTQRPEFYEGLSRIELTNTKINFLGN